MLPKIIRKGETPNNIKENFEYPVIEWEELVKNKEERIATLIKEQKEKKLQENDKKHHSSKPKKEEKIENNNLTQQKLSVDLEFIKDEAAKILAEANAKKEEIEKHAYQQGYSSGKAIGIEEGKREYSQALTKLENSIEKIITLKQEILREYEPEIIKLAISIAEKILKREVRVNSEHIVEIVKSIVNTLKDKSKITVNLSTDDYSVLKNSEKLNELKYISSNFEIVEKPELQKGDVLVDTAFGTIDATIDSQLEKVKEELV
jgi:flagellar assembly protein FliH